MSLLEIPTNNPSVDFILSEISKLSFEEREVVRISLAAEYWQSHLHELVQHPVSEDELNFSEINSIKHQSRKAIHA